MAQYEEKVTKFNELMKDHNDWMRNSINLIASEKNCYGFRFVPQICRRSGL